MKAVRKIVGKKKVEYEANKSTNPAVSNLLMSGWKEEEEEEEDEVEENGTNL